MHLFLNLLVLGALLGLGGFLLFQQRLLINKGLRSYRWPHVIGVVKSRRVETYLTRSLLSGEQNPLAQTRHTGIAYLYEYQVNEQTYTTENYCYGPRSELRIVEYVIGHHLPIYYDPRNPAEAVIQPGLTLRPLLGLVPLAIAFFIILLWIGI